MLMKLALPMCGLKLSAGFHKLDPPDIVGWAILYCQDLSCAWQGVHQHPWSPGLNTSSILYPFSSHDKPMSPDIVKCFQEGKTTPSWEPLVYGNEVTGPRSQINASRLGEILTCFSVSLWSSVFSRCLSPTGTSSSWMFPAQYLCTC